MQLPGALRWKVVRRGAYREQGSSALDISPILFYRIGEWTQDCLGGRGIFVFRELRQAQNWDYYQVDPRLFRVVPVWCQEMKLDLYPGLPEGTERFKRAFPLEVKE